MKVPKLKVQRRYKDYQVSSTALYNDKGKAAGSLILVKRCDGSFIALVDTPCLQGTIIGKCDGTQTFMKATRKPDFYKTDYIISPKQIAEAKAEAKKHNPKVDAFGNYHVTVFVGLSQGAVSFVGGNATAYALAELETVNLGLRNSLVNNVVLDLAEVGITPTEHPISVPTLNNLPVIFPGSLLRADLVAGFFLGIPNQDTAVGYGSLGGRLSVNWVPSPTVFRHEVGHNAGGNHCNSGQDNFRFGYNNGRSQTILCGNSIPFYSNPHISDQFNLPLGDQRTADMARQWREYAPQMSSWSAPTFHLENRMARGLCLDILNHQTRAVGIFTCANNNPNQRWISDSTGRIRSGSGGNLCLGGNGNGGFVTVQSCVGTDPRILWRVSNENYINLSNNQLLTPLSAANHTQVILSPATGSDLQRWIQEPPITPPTPRC